MGDQIPTQVRIRTDPDDDYGHRYEAIQRAKEVFDVGNNTGAIIAACEHARRDEQGKREAMAYLSRHVGDDVLEAVAERLSTRSMPVETERSIYRHIVCVSSGHSKTGCVSYGINHVDDCRH